MSDVLKDRILRHVRHDSYEPAKSDQLAEELGVSLEDRADFAAALNELIRTGHVIGGGSDTIALPPLGKELVGRFKLNPKGFGFVIPDTPNAHGDLFVPPGNNGSALTGDIVRAKVVKRGRKGPAGRSPFTGEIIEVVQRRHNQFAGTLTQKGKTFLVIPDGSFLADPIIVRDPGAKHAGIGQKVVVELTHFPEKNYLPEGVITEVLGDPGKPDVETDAVCRSYNLPDTFPDDVLDQAREAVRQYDADPAAYSDDSNRTDLTNQYIITIDPPDAQDYDDAISITHTDKGIELGVHIADVAAFVPEGTRLDEEAKKRGNSAYLPRRVIPMLPEVLSNGVCSLQPNVIRLARSVFITYDKTGHPTSTRFARSLIKSAHRLTYIEAQNLIDGNPDEARKHAKYDAPYTDKLIETLKQMESLSKTIRKRRHKQGMIVLDLPEVELVYDEQGHVVDAQPEDDSFTHKLIEMFMVEANEAVARVFADLDVPLIRRTHPDPGAADIGELSTFARVAGYNIPANPTRKDLQQLLDAVRDKPAARAVHFAVLRTLTKAEYSPALIGHFALASEHYTHYTSPIRRYTDLLVHRALDALAQHLGPNKSIPKEPKKRKALANRMRSDSKLPSLDDLYKLGSHCSSTEQNAEAAERELREVLVLQLLEKHVGEEFDGTVAGVTNFGLFVQIDKYLVEGMVRSDALPGAPADRWQVNKFTGSITAQRSGRSITLGDKMRVLINKIDITKREMDLLIVEPKGAGAGTAASRRKRKQEVVTAGPGKGQNDNKRTGGRGRKSGPGKSKKRSSKRR